MLSPADQYNADIGLTADRHQPNAIDKHYAPYTAPKYTDTDTLYWVKGQYYNICRQLCDIKVL